MSEPLIFIAKRGELSTRGRSDLRKAGITVIEVTNLADCKFLRPDSTLDAGDFAYAALAALAHDGGYGETGRAQRDRLVSLMAKIAAKRAAPVGEETQQ